MADNSKILTLLPEDSLASLSVLPGSKEARKMTGTSGLNISGLYRKSDPVGLLVKMLLESSVWNSTLCYLTWKVKTTPAKRLLFQLVPSMPDTEGIECGLWQTPDTMTGLTFKSQETMDRQAETSRKGRTRAGNLRDQVAVAEGVRMWPTPDANNRGARVNQNGHQVTLQDAVKLLPTPTAQDAKNNGAQSQMERNTKPLNAEIGGSLNPQFVEWLMGYPIGWTDLKDSETP